jgi:hypothetical protein
MQKLEPLQGSGTGSYLFFALLMIGIVGCVGYGVLSEASGGGGDATESRLITVLVLCPVLFIGGIFLLFAIKSSYSNYKAPNADVFVSSNPLMLGDEFTVNYQQGFRGGATLNSIRYDFIFRESATYTQGTDTYTVHHDVVMNTFELPAQRLSGGESLQTQFTFQVPPTAMHSFHANDNKLRWIIRAKIDIQGWAHYENEYEITVLPMKRELVTQGF